MNKGRKKAPATTAHKRRITLYLSSKPQIDKWTTEADKAGLSVSKFIQSIVNDYFEEGDILKSQKTLEKQLLESNKKIQQLHQNNVELLKKTKMLETLTDKYEEDIKRLKNQAFATEYITDGIRTHDKELVKLFREKKNVKEHEIFEFLNVDPKDKEAVRAVENQLTRYLAEDIIKIYKGCYQWIG
jgi:hypothetical protein